MLSSSPTSLLSDPLFPNPPPTLHPLSLLLSGPFYHSFKLVVALKPLANLSMSLFRAGQWPASPLPPGCRLIDGPLLGEWQAALVRHWCAGVTAAAAATISLCWGPQDLPARGLAQFAGARSEQLPGVLVVAEQLVSSLQPVHVRFHFPFVLLLFPYRHLLHVSPPRRRYSSCSICLSFVVVRGQRTQSFICCTDRKKPLEPHSWSVILGLINI